MVCGLKNKRFEGVALRTAAVHRLYTPDGLFGLITERAVVFVTQVLTVHSGQVGVRRSSHATAGQGEPVLPLLILKQTYLPRRG